MDVSFETSSLDGPSLRAEKVRGLVDFQGTAAYILVFQEHT